jgi:hypothetical protein
MKLRELLVETRLVLKDVGVKSQADSLLIGAANEAKDEMVQIIRQAREDFFLTSAIIAIPTASPPLASIVTLPADFMNLRDLAINDLGFEGIIFQFMNQSDPRFRRALIDGGVYQAGTALCFYNIRGNAQLVLAPGFDVPLNLTVLYLQAVPDMVGLEDEITSIPKEFHHYMSVHMICDALRMAANSALEAFEKHLEEKKKFMIQNIEPRQSREPVFVRGFMEDEW